MRRSTSVILVICTFLITTSVIGQDEAKEAKGTENTELTKKQKKAERKKKMKSEISLDSKDGLIDGILLYADETGVLIWNDKDGTIDPEELNGNVSFIQPSSMIRVSRKNRVLGTSVLYGFVIGLGAGIAASEVIAGDDKELETENLSLIAMGGLTAIGGGIGWLLGNKNGGPPYNEPIDGDSKVYKELLPKIKQSVYYKESIPDEVIKYVAEQLE